MDQDVMNWWLEFEEKKPDENVIDTFESQINFAVLFYIFAVSTLLIWYYIVLPIIV